MLMAGVLNARWKKLSGILPGRGAGSKRETQIWPNRLDFRALTTAVVAVSH